MVVLDTESFITGVVFVVLLWSSVVVNFKLIFSGLFVLLLQEFTLCVELERVVAKGSSINHVDMEGGNQMYILLHKPCLMKWSIKVKRRSKISKKLSTWFMDDS